MVFPRVKEWLKSARQWLRARLRHITISTVIIIVIILAFFGWLTFVFMVGDDLILDVQANQTSFHITNLEDASAKITISTKNQMFCAAACSFTVLNVSTNAITTRKNYTITRGQKIEEVVNITPRRVGEGQVIYSVTASCHNVRSTLCPTLSPQRAKTVLLTVNYGLPPTDAQLKPFLKVSIEQMLGLLRDTDLVLLRSQFLLSENPALRPGTLIANLATLEDAFAQQTLLLEQAKVLWADEQYADLYDLTANETESLNQTLIDAHLLQEEILELPQINNRLLEQAATARAAVVDLLTAYNYLTLDAESVPVRIELANETDSLSMVAAQQLYQSYPELQLRITHLQNNTGKAREYFQNRTISLVLQGNALIEKETLCVTCNTTNETNQSLLLSISEICAAMNTLTVNLSPSTVAYQTIYCSQQLPPDVNMTELANISLVLHENISSVITTQLPDNLPLCCVFGECQACCTTQECKDDPSTYPVVFVHGHAFNGGNSPEYSLGGYFIRIQHELQSDGYLDAGIITPSSTLSEMEEGEWGLSGKPVTTRVTYYYNFYRDGTAYTVITQKSESIETYAIRLKELIDIVKHHTGKEKVQIVAHSMGGLVVRRYMQLFGEDSIDGAIFIATPHQGIDASTQRLCPLLGETKECADMAKSSVFMRKLNDPAAQPDVRMVTITGHGCDMNNQDGDGVVEARNAYLPGAKNYDIKGNCSDLFNSELHTELLNIEKYPRTYEIIKEELRK